MSHSNSADFRILTVCTGNICRSPVAEQYLRAGLHALPSVSVSSAGTLARDGDMMPAQAIDLAHRHGANASRHGARFLVPHHVREADLIFGLAREHRRAVVTMHPRAVRLTFTLREFARLAADLTDDDLAAVALMEPEDTAGRLRAAVEIVTSRRGLVDPPLTADEDDVVDPYRQDDQIFAESGRQIFPAADRVISLLLHSASIRPTNLR